MVKYVCRGCYIAIQIYCTLTSEFTVLCATATVQSRIQGRYKLYKQKIKRNRTANMQVRPSQIIMVMLEW